MKASNHCLELAEQMVKNTDNINALFDDYKYNNFSIGRFVIDLVFHHAKWGEYAATFTKQVRKEGLTEPQVITVVKRALKNHGLTY